MKILVTGSSGMIGTALCERLLHAGHDVKGIDRRPNPWHDSLAAITVYADCMREEHLRRGVIAGQWDCVVHLAANARVHDLVVKPQLALENCISTHNVLEFCRTNGVRKVVFASSRECYGNLEEQPVAEDRVRLENTASPYAASKLYGEALVRSYSRCYGMKAAIVRFSNVYGRYDESDRVIPLFVRQALAGETLTVFGHQKVLDFTYLDDAVAGLLRVLEADTRHCSAWNIASGEASTLEEAARLVIEATGSQSQVQVTPVRPGEVYRYAADVSAIRKLGYQPKVMLAEGIQRAVEWHRRRQDASGTAAAAR